MVPTISWGACLGKNLPDQCALAGIDDLVVQMSYRSCDRKLICLMDEDRRQKSVRKVFEKELYKKSIQKRLKSAKVGSDYFDGIVKNPSRPILAFVLLVENTGDQMMVKQVHLDVLQGVKLFRDRGYCSLTSTWSEMREVDIADPDYSKLSGVVSELVDDLVKDIQTANKPR